MLLWSALCMHTHDTYMSTPHLPLLQVLRKRQQAQALRERRAAVLAEKSKRLLHIRQLAATQAEQRRDTTKTTRQVEEATLRSRADCEAVLLLGRLQAKHKAAAEEAARVAAENKRVMFEQMQRAAGAAVVEEQKFRCAGCWLEGGYSQHSRQSALDAGGTVWLSRAPPPPFLHCTPA